MLNAFNPDPSPSPNSRPVLTAAERLSKINDALSGQMSGNWTIGDSNVSINATMKGYDIDIHGVKYLGNPDHYRFELDSAGQVKSASAYKQIGCLMKNAPTPGVDKLDSILSVIA